MTKLVEIAWAAGVYEGEGNFTGDVARVVQKDKWLPDELQRVFGGKVKPYIRKKDGKRYWHWTLSGQNARGFILTIFTFLSPRRKAQILKYPLFFKDPNFLPANFCPNGHEYTPENTFTETGLNEKGEERTWRTCKICRKDKYDRKNAVRSEPSKIFVDSYAKLMGVSKDEARKFLEGISNEKE